MTKKDLENITLYTGPSQELKDLAVSLGLSLWRYSYQCGNVSPNWNTGIELRTETGLYSGWFTQCTFDDSLSNLAVSTSPYQSTEPHATKIYP